MPRISCTVASCSYNQEGICGANVLSIGGKGARITESTCCETYLKSGGYNNSVEGTAKSGHTEAIRCKVDTCAYHANEHCSLNEIEVSSLKDVEHYSETDCLSFERE